MLIPILLFGLLIGSFLNCVIYRSGVGLSYIKGRSMCPKCKHQLSWKDNIPLFSFILLRGKCRYCHKKINLLYPLIEIITAALFIIVYFVVGENPGLLLYSFWITGAFLAIFMIDLLYGIIPDEILIVTLLVSLPYSFVFPPYFIITALISFLVFLGIYLFTREKGIGFGDVKLSFLIGCILGYPATIYAFYFAFLTGAFVGVILVISRRKKLKGSVPFGPFMCLGTFIFFFWGSQIIKWFTAHFF